MLMSSSQIIYLTTKLRCEDSVPVLDRVTTFVLLVFYFCTCVATIADVSEIIGGTVFRIWLVTTLGCIVILLWFRTFKCVD